MCAGQLLVDIGANLTDKRFDRDREQVIERALTAGVERIVVTGSDLPSSVAALELCRRYPQQLRATVGIHPHHSSSFSAQAAREISELAGDPAICAIGETGLDFFRDFSPRAVQEQAFEEQLELAAKLSLPVFLHERDAWPRFAEILKHWRERLTKVVVHCFTGSRQALHDYLELDCYIGITGWICDPKRGRRLRKLVGLVPSERLMIETDAPWLLPTDDSRTPPVKGRNEPALLPLVLQQVAASRGEDSGRVAQQTSANAIDFFRLPALQQQS